VLISHFLARTQRNTGRQHIFTDEAMHLMQEYRWPGNVRELENAIDRLCTLSSGALLNLAGLPSQLQEFRLQALQVQQLSGILTPTEPEALGTDTALTRGRGSAIVSIAELEKQAILNTIRQLHGDKLMAARLLQIGKTTLYRKLKEYGISDGTPDAPLEVEEMN
jgi:DNA-binding NtrC family response regulator